MRLFQVLRRIRSRLGSRPRLEVRLRLLDTCSELTFFRTDSQAKELDALVECLRLLLLHRGTMPVNTIGPKRLYHRGSIAFST